MSTPSSRTRSCVTNTIRVTRTTAPTSTSRASTPSPRAGACGAYTRTARRSTSISEQHLIETAVLPAELEQLPDLTGYLKTAASPELRGEHRRLDEELLAD